MKLLLTGLLLGLLFMACNKKAVPSLPLTEGELLLAKTVNAHGGSKYDKAHFGFTFRGKYYTFKNDKNGYKYTLKHTKDDALIQDTLTNGAFVRHINGGKTRLTEKQSRGGSAGINSVIYFATLPYKLQDDAVNTRVLKPQTIKGTTYQVLEVTFEEEGGGADHDDQFHYWIHPESNLIDYLAYNYKVGKGGVRFRTGYNKQTIGGITFQDFVNYKAPVGTPLSELPILFEAGKLKELSKIETEQIVNLK